MLFRDQFDKRARELYKSQYNLSRPVKEDGVIVRPGVKLPFTPDEFALWLFREIGLQAKPCPYGCGRVIDVINCSIDHKIPRGQEGTFELENLCACCEDCNTLKGNMTAHSFLILLEAARQMYAKDWELLRKRIMIGGHAQQDRWRAIRAQRELQKVKGVIPRRRPKPQAPDPFF